MLSERGAANRSLLRTKGEFTATEEKLGKPSQLSVTQSPQPFARSVPLDGPSSGGHTRGNGAAPAPPHALERGGLESTIGAHVPDSVGPPGLTLNGRAFTGPNRRALFQHIELINALALIILSQHKLIVE